MSVLAVWELVKAGTCCSEICQKYDVASLPSMISATSQNTLNLEFNSLLQIIHQQNTIPPFLL